MQVNNVQSSPNFGMALKISSKAMNSLKENSVKELEKIGKIGEELKGHKYVDVVLGEGAKPVVTTKYANAYDTYFRPEKPHNELLEIKTKWAGTESGELKKGSEYVAWYDLGSRDAALNAYDKMQAAHSDIEKATEFAKVIEESTALKVAKEAEAKEKLEAQITMADKLFSKFGVNNFI